MLGRIGELVVRRPRAVLIIAAVLTVAAVVAATGTLSALVLNRWEAPGSESVRVQRVLADQFGTGNPNLVLLVTAHDLEDAAVAEAGRELTAELAAEPAVVDAWSYWTTGSDQSMISRNGRSGMVLAHVTGDPTTARAVISEELLPSYTRDGELIDVRVGGGEAVSSQVSEQARRDFFRAEMIVLPLMLILLTVLYRRFRLALLTLAVGVFAVVGTLAALRGLAMIIEISTFAANLTLVLGIGLGVNYCLFMITRFREELRAGASAPDAVRAMMRTAGRTVVFSSVTVAAALAVMLAFPYPFLQSFGYAGILAAAFALVGVLIIIPPALLLLGDRALPRGRVRSADHRGWWYRFGDRVMRRPVIFTVAATAVLLVIAIPVTGLRIGLPDDRVLPPSASTRQTYDAMRAAYDQEPQDAVQIVTSTGGDAAPARIDGYARTLSGIDGAASVNATTGTYVDGERVGGYGGQDRLVGDQQGSTAMRLEVVPNRELLSGTEVPAFVEQIRSVPTPFDEVMFGGATAELTDFREVMVERLPLVGVLILLVTMIVLFAMTGSMIIPIKAAVLNLLSLAVMFSAMVVIFQNGVLADLLGFTAIGTLDPTFPILIFCIAYAMSMDYEVFMLSRIKERWNATGDNRRAVLEGLQSSAPLVTSAAVALALSFSVYASGEVMYLKMLGIGVAIAIAIDATVIRAVLMPALMRLLGNVNWWAPPPLRRLQLRLDPHRPAGTASADPVPPSCSAP